MESLRSLEACTPRSASTHQGQWARVITPLKVAAWMKAMADHPDREFAEYICEGVRGGFRIGFDYRRAKCKAARGTMKSVREHKDVVDQYIQKEREAGRLLGPFERLDWPEVHTSPFGVIPKSEPGKWRLIVDLSSPGGASVNDGISKELCSLSYMSVDQVAEKVLELGRGALVAKFDLKSAYRNVPVHPDDRWLLGMIWEDQLFVDAVLPFGLRSAPKIFNAVADALAYVIRKRGVKWLDHYLDDYVIVGPAGSDQCGRDLRMALETCDEVGFPVAAEKTVGPATRVPLLGIEIDSDELELRLPESKLGKLKSMIAKWRKRKACTKRELQSLAGHLSHACKVVRPGRRFLRGLFGLISQFGRPDHTIRLNAAFRADLEWWHNFLAPWNGVAIMRREDQPAEIEIWSDASGSWGCGAVWGMQWFQVAWAEWPEFAGAPIAAKELLPIIIAAAIWGSSWVGKKVLCHCDNQAVVEVIRGGYCRESAMAHMLRCLFYLEASSDLHLSAVHIPGIDNGVADAISRNNLETFFTLFPQAVQVPCRFPPGLVEGLVVQRPWNSADWTRWLRSLWTNPSPQQPSESTQLASGSTCPFAQNANSTHCQ